MSNPQNHREPDPVAVEAAIAPVGPTDPTAPWSDGQIAESLPSGWIHVEGALAVTYRTGDFSAGVAFVDAVAAAAEGRNHHPDVGLTYGAVSITLSSHDVGAVTVRDLGLAREIAGLAAAAGLLPEPAPAPPSVRSESGGIRSAARDNPAIATEELLVEVDGGVMTLTINRPERRNALSWDVVSGLRRAVRAARDDDTVGAIVITGAGDRAFSAGADLGGMADGASVSDLHRARGDLAALFADLYGCGKPTIAKVRGYCLAGGFGLALACDLVVASSDATFGTPEINVGLWPYMITVPLTRSMPPKKALELMMTGRRIDAAEADRLGLLTAVVDPDALDAAVAETAATLASKSPTVMALGRDSFYSVWGRPASEALAQLHPLLSLNASLEDAAEGIGAFLDKREPRWRGR
ncbi:MAG: enoyl-CoA hydratase-related protein [Microthrixaceae bacterium]